MEERVFKILEYDKIISMLEAKAVSQMGKERAIGLEPAESYEQACILLEQTDEAYTILMRSGRQAVDAFPDVRAPLKKAHATLAMGMGELLMIARALRCSRLCKDSLLRDDVGPRLRTMGGSLYANRGVEEEIFRCIISEEEMADSASSRLSALRRQIKSCNDRVRDKLNSMIHSSTYKTYLQDPIITMRNGRYVLPVKQEHRSQVAGLLHDSSGTGATLFIEPMAIVEIGNELKRFMSEEQDEIERILCALTQMVAPEAGIFITSLDIMAGIDLIFAKAFLARAMNANLPELNQRGFVRIAAARHPLIDREQVVPIDIWLGDMFKTLIITGPNTGGKTVTLKTVGLFSMMSMSGMFLPAQRAELAFFDSIYADIGDEQSIAQSLSTFSSHMKNIVSILDKADSASLILLDELGSGTDPVEGAALAMALLEELHTRKATTLATTHYSELKAFALTHEGMENASMEFDVRTLRPTYRLFIGIPGKSNAFEISRKLGLSDRIIKSAQKHLDNEQVSFEDVISSAQSQKAIAEQERELAEQARNEVYRLRELAEKERKSLEEQRDKILKKAKDEAKIISSRAKAEAESIIKELKSVKDVQGDSDRERAIQNARDKLRESDKKLANKDEETQKDMGKAPKSVKVGDSVYLVKLDSYGVVNSLPDSKGEVNVQAGIMKVNALLKDLRLGDSPKEKKEKGAIRSKLAAKSVGLEIDVRGMMADEAIYETDMYLDNAQLNGLHEVSVIHGKGTGALRSAIQDYLRGNSRVKQFRLGKYGEGETGVTIITLK